MLVEFLKSELIYMTRARDEEKRTLSTRVFETRTATGSELFSLSLYLTSIKYLFSIRDG